MKESEKEEKEKPSSVSSKNSFDIIRETLEKLKKEGAPLREVPMQEGEYVAILNPPKSLVEKMHKAKQEEPAKKKK